MSPPTRPARIVELLQRLDDHGVEFVLIGGVAGQVHGLTRATDDVDVFPAMTRDNYERLADALRGLNARMRIGRGAEPFPFPEPISAEYLQSVSNWTLSTNLGDLDIVAAADGGLSYAEVRRDAASTELGPGLVVHVASRDVLVRMKRASGRASDLADVEALERAAQLEERRRDPT